MSPTDALPLARFTDRRGERSRRAALPAAGHVARRQDRGRSRRHGAQDRAARRRSGAPRAAAPAARRKRAVPVPQHLEALAGPRSRGPRPAAPRSRKLLDTADAVLFEEPASIAALARAGRATPIEIAAFPLEMNAASRPVSEFTLLALGGLLHMVGEPERKPLRLGGHQASYAAGLTAFTGLDRRARRARCRPEAAVGARVARRSAAMGELEGGVGRGRHRHLARPRRQEVGVPDRALPRRPRGRRLHRDAMARDARADRRPAARAIRSSTPAPAGAQHIAELYAIITPWFADKTRAEIQKTAQAKGVPFGPIFSPAELLETEQYVARGFLAELEHPDSSARSACRSFPCSGTAAPSRRAGASALPSPLRGRWRVLRDGGGIAIGSPPPSRQTLTPPRNGGGREAERPLAGIRVLDFGLLTAGANTSAMLADLGADVLKIESGAYLDPFRVVGKPDDEDGWWNRSPQFRFTNRNKRGLALNLKAPEGQRVIRELAQQCDVVVENFRRGVLDRAGLGYKDLSAINPRLVFAAISSQGDTGPERMNVSFGSTLDATSGIAVADRLRGRGAAHLGHGRELPRPDRLAVRDRHGHHRRHGGAPHRQGLLPRLLAARGRVLHPGRGDPRRGRRSGPSPRAAAATAKTGVPQQDAYRCRDGRWIAVTLDDADPTSTACARRRTAPRRLPALLAKGIAGGAVQRRHRSAARQGARRRDAGPRRARRAGEGPALSARRQGHRDRTRRARSRTAHRRGIARACWATTMPSWKRSPRRA